MINRYSPFFFLIVIVLLSCKGNYILEEGIDRSGNYYIALKENQSIDTIFEFEKRLEVVGQLKDRDTLELIVKTDRFFDYLVLSKGSLKWKVNEEKSSCFMSNYPEDNYRFTILDDHIQIESMKETLLLPKRKLSKRKPSFFYKENSITPPLPPISFYSISVDLKNDSILNIREQKVNVLRTDLSDLCGVEGTFNVIQFEVNEDGKIKGYKIVRGPKNQIDSLKFLNCVSSYFDESGLELGSFSEIKSNRIRKVSQYTIPLSK